jgi:actin
MHAAFNVATEVCTQRTFDLPDGQTISLGEEEFLAPEGLFNPKMFNKEGYPSLPKAIEQCLATKSEEMTAIKSGRVVFSGGASLLPGLEYRLGVELEKLGQKLTLHFPPEREFSAWIGA